MSDYISALSCGIYTDEEFKSIIEFFVLNAPVLKADKTDDFGLKSLKNFGWYGSSGMNKLECELLKASQLPFLCFIRSSSINATLEQMNLNDQICIEHPRAVLMQNYSFSILENGVPKIENAETRMECLFRHIRNSIAHNHTYVFDNGFIMLEDYDSKSKEVTARILIHKTALLRWIHVIKKDNAHWEQPASECQSEVELATIG